MPRKCPRSLNKYIFVKSNANGFSFSWLDCSSIRLHKIILGAIDFKLNGEDLYLETDSNVRMVGELDNGG